MGSGVAIMNTYTLLRATAQDFFATINCRQKKDLLANRSFLNSGFEPPVYRLKSLSNDSDGLSINLI
jgi:hypothetical protein